MPPKLSPDVLKKLQPKLRMFADGDTTVNVIRAERSAALAVDRPALLKRVRNITYQPQFGFLVVVDSLRGDYSNLGLAYFISRELACADRTVEMEADLLTILLDRIISEAEELAEIRKLVESNISNSNDIIAHLEKGVLSLEFCRMYLKKFLNDGTLSKADLLDFYSGGDRREKYRAIQQKIETMSK